MNNQIFLLLISGIVTFLMGAVIMQLSKSYPKSIQGLSECAYACFILVAAALMFLMRGYAPDLLTIVVANASVFAGYLMMEVGTKRLLEQTDSNHQFLLYCLGGFILLLLWFTYVDADVRARVFLLSVFTGFLLMIQILRVKKIPQSTGRNFLLFSLAILLCSKILRAGSVVLGVHQPASIYETSLVQMVFVAIPAVMIPVVAISFIMLASDKYRELLEYSTRHDDLTGCLSKKAFIEELEKEITYARRYKNKLSIMMLDLDNFKEINDRFGHLVGDETLIDFAKKVHLSLRETDCFARFGGDEFVIIFPNTDIQQVELVATRIHTVGRESQPVPWGVSIGIAEWQGEEDSLDVMLARADKLLYKSKVNGGSQFYSV